MVGRLTLVGTPIGNLEDLSPRAVRVLHDADVIAAEDTRRTRALLTHASVAPRGRLRSVRGENERDAAVALVRDIEAGAHVAYVTDAGMPAVSDPGAHLVRECVAADLPVDCVPGPSAVLVALALSGLPTSRFVFEGFLPRKGGHRRERLEALATEPRTTVLFESPHRVVAALSDLAATCGRDRAVAVARELTKLHQEVWRGQLGAAAHAVGDRPRGEFVIVVDGAAPTPVGDEAVIAAVDRVLAAGKSPRDAASEVARVLGVERRRAYEVALTRPRS